MSEELYDLEEVETICFQHGLEYNRISNSEIEVTIAPDIVLLLANIENGSDTYLGFRDLPWHAHGSLLLMTGETTYVEYDPSELLLNLTSGNVVVVSQYVRGQLRDRWLAHRDEKVNVQFIEPE